MQQGDSQKFVNGKPLSQLLVGNEKRRQPMAGRVVGQGQAGGVVPGLSRVVGSVVGPGQVAGRAWLVKPAGEEICVAKLSDDELYQKCRQYGMNAKVWLRKFAGLLPEVAKRGLHRRKGFISIGEFAGKLAGMSEYAVDKILNLAKNLENKPALRKLFESGAEGWSKIAAVAYVSTIETDKFWADKLLLLSKPALEAFVQNYRRKFTPGGESQSLIRISQGGAMGLPFGTDGGKNGTGRPPGAAGGLLSSGGGVVGALFSKGEALFEPHVRFSFPASKEVEFDLRLAKQKLEKQSKQVLSWNETFKKLIQKSELVTGKIVPASIGNGIFENGKSDIDQKRVGFCSKCHKKADIRNMQVCDNCMKATTKQ